MLSTKPLLFILSLLFTVTSLASQPTALIAENLIDQNNPSSEYWVLKTLDLLEKNNIPLTEENLSAFFIQVR
jgi:hypothetical protein